MLRFTANILEMHPNSVRALRPRIESDEPEWVEWVKSEWSARRGDVESVAFWAEVPIQAVVAILLNLDKREELKTSDI